MGKGKHIAKAVFTVGSIVGGTAANVPLVQDTVANVRQYNADGNKAEELQAAAQAAWQLTNSADMSCPVFNLGDEQREAECRKKIVKANDDATAAESKASLQSVAQDEDSDRIKRDGLEIVMLDGALAYGIKKTLDARKKRKVDNFIDRVTNCEESQKRSVDSYIEQLETQFGGNSRSV